MNVNFLKFHNTAEFNAAPELRLRLFLATGDCRLVTVYLPFITFFFPSQRASHTFDILTEV
jgi:hypothetical protein